MRRTGRGVNARGGRRVSQTRFDDLEADRSPGFRLLMWSRAARSQGRLSEGRTGRCSGPTRARRPMARPTGGEDDRPFGRSDVPANGAAVFGGGLIGRITEEAPQRIFRVDVFAAAHLEAAKGCVIDTSSCSTSVLGKKGRLSARPPRARPTLSRARWRWRSAACARTRSGDRYLGQGDGGGLRRLHHDGTRQAAGGE